MAKSIDITTLLWYNYIVKNKGEERAYVIRGSNKKN